MNESALIAVGLFATAFLAIVGTLYVGASKSHKRGEMDFEGIAVLRWAILGFFVLYGLLALSAFLE